jgi:SAM-dependent MidA family methyltransferase
MDAALYDPDHGFYATGGSAGRRGDFLTSPEVGPLFGAVVARALDRWWDELRRPDPYVVVDAGAGPGTLARAVLAAAPACAPALRYVLVERSAAQREQHRAHLPLEEPAFAFAPRRASGAGPIVVSLPDLPRVSARGVVLANELLDNLPVRLLQRGKEGWEEVRVGLAGDAGPLAEHLVPAPPDLAALATRLAPAAEPGARVPVQEAAQVWLRAALAALERGRVVVVDYATTTAALAARPSDEWLRTYRAHGRGGAPIADLGAQDITCEVAVDQLARVRAPDAERAQHEVLAEQGIDDLVAEGRRIWAERAGVGDLEAVRARSRITEAEALTDPAGLGAFRVLEWAVTP